VTAPIGRGSPALGLPPPLSLNSGEGEKPRQNIAGGARSAPITPGRRMPVIDRSKVDPRIREAGEGMEAMFLDYMMKVMRETVPKSDMDLESPASGIYRSMLDSETATRAAKTGGIGLADQIIAYLDSRQYNLPQGHEAPSAKSVNQPRQYEAAAPKSQESDKSSRSLNVHGGTQNAGEQHGQ
jgi:Rod binding domain-containing protein